MDEPSLFAFRLITFVRYGTLEAGVSSDSNFAICDSFLLCLIHRLVLRLLFQKKTLKKRVPRSIPLLLRRKKLVYCLSSVGYFYILLYCPTALVAKIQNTSIKRPPIGNCF